MNHRLRAATGLSLLAALAVVIGLTGQAWAVSGLVPSQAQPAYVQSGTEVQVQFTYDPAVDGGKAQAQLLDSHGAIVSVSPDGPADTGRLTLVVPGSLPDAWYDLQVITKAPTAPDGTPMNFDHVDEAQTSPYTGLYLYTEAYAGNWAATLNWDMAYIKADGTIINYIAAGTSKTGWLTPASNPTYEYAVIAYDTVNTQWMQAHLKPYVNDAAHRVDFLGQRSAKLEKKAVLVDTVAPPVPGKPSVISPTRLNQPGVTVLPVADPEADEAPIGRYIVLVDGQQAGEVPGTAGVWTPAAPLADGNHAIAVVCEDKAGNRSGASEAAALLIDSQAPTATMAAEPAWTQGTTNEVSATASDGSGTGVDKFQFRAYTNAGNPDGSEVGRSGWLDAGQWAFASLGDGTRYFYQVRAMDLVGNQSAWSAAVSSSQDASKPTLVRRVFDSSVDPVVELPVGKYTAHAAVRIDVSSIADAGSGVVVDDAGRPIVVATLRGTPLSGTYNKDTKTWSFAGTLTEGSNVVSVQVADIVGNVQVAEGTWYLDTTAPALSDPYPVNGAVLDQTGVTKQIQIKVAESGSGLNAAASTVKLDGAAVSGSTYASGVFSLPVQVGNLTNGKHTVEIVASDYVGNKATAFSWSFTTDDGVPPLTFKADTKTISQDSTVDGAAEIVANRLPKLTVAIAAGPSGVAQYELKVDGEVVAATLADNVVSYQVAQALDDGLHSMSIEGKTGAGKSFKTAAAFGVDATGPVVLPSTDPELVQVNGELWSPANLEIQLLAADQYARMSRLDLYLDGQLVSPGGVEATALPPVADEPPELGQRYTFHGLKVGPHSWRVIAVDQVGNQTKLEGIINVDDAAPTVKMTAPENGVTLHQPDAKDVVATVSDEGAGVADKANLSVDAGVPILVAVSSGMIRWDASGLTDGSHTVTVTVADRVGHGASASVAFTLDTTGPTISNVQPAAGAVLGGEKVVIQATVTPKPVQAAIVVDGVENPVTADADGIVKYEVTAAGEHEFQVKATDADGNTTPSSSQSFTFDPVPPTVLDTNLVNGGYYSAHPLLWVKADGTHSPVSMVAITVDGGGPTAFGYNATTKRWELNAGWAAGNRTLMLSVTDAANNTITREYNILVDTEAPSVGYFDAAYADSKPAFSVTVSDTGGSGIDPSRVEQAKVQKFDYGMGQWKDTSELPLQVTYDSVGGKLDVSATAVIPDGTYYVEFRVSDLAGNQNTEWSAIVVDTTAPSFHDARPATTAVVGPQSPLGTVAVTAEDMARQFGKARPYPAAYGGEIRVHSAQVGGQAVAASYSPETGLVRLPTAGLNLSDGPVQFQVVAGDYYEFGDMDKPVENVTAPFGWSAVWDGTTPQVVSLTPANGSSINNPRPVMSLTVSDPHLAHAALLAGGTVVAEADANDDTSITLTYTPTDPLAAGSHSFQVAAVDVAGNALAYTWTFNVTPAVPVLEKEAPAGTTDDATPTVSAKVTPNGVPIAKEYPAYVKVDGLALQAKYDDAAKRIAVTVPDAKALADGQHVVVVGFGTVTASGLVDVAYIPEDATPVTWKFEVDTSGPELAANGLALAGQKLAFEFAVKDATGIPADGATVSAQGINAADLKVTVVGGTPREKTVQVEYTGAALLPDGSYDVTAKVKDVFGHETVHNWTFVLDNTAPVLGAVTPADGVKINAVSTVSVEAKDQESGIDLDRTVLAIGGHSVKAASLVSGKLAFDVAGVPLSDGNQSWTVQVYNRAGVSASKNGSFLLDRVAPVIIEEDVLPQQGAVVNSRQVQVPTKPGEHDVDGNLSKATVTINGEALAAAAITVQPQLVTFQLPAAVKDGAVTIVITVQDAVGNIDSYFWSYTLDETAPKVGSWTPGKDAAYNGAKLVITASEPVEATVVQLNAGESTYSFTEADDKVLQIAGNVVSVDLVEAGISDGVYTVLAKIVDGAGNANAAAPATLGTFTFDRTEPVIQEPVQPIPHSYVRAGVVVSAGIDDNLSGIASATVQLDGGTGVNALATPEGADPYVYALLNAAEGSHQVKLVVSDRAGNAVEATWGFKVDATAPVIGDLLVQNKKSEWITGTSTNNRGTNLKVALSDALAGLQADTVQVSLKDASSAQVDFTVDQAELLKSGALIVDPDATPGLPDGSYTLVVSAADAVGNRAERTFRITIDTIPPEAPAVHALPPVSKVPVTVTWDAVASADLAGYQVAYNLTGQTPEADPQTVIVPEIVTGTSADVGGLTDRTKYYFFVRSVDKAGNSSVWLIPGHDAVFTVTDAVPPQVAISAPASDAEFGGADLPVIVKGTVDDAVEATLAVDGGAPESLTISASKIEMTLSGLADGEHTVVLKAKDAAGNEGSATVKFTIDATAPQLAGFYPADGAKVVISKATIYFTIPADADSVSLTVDGNAVSASNYWKIGNKLVYAPAQIAPWLDGKQHEIAITLTDALGNSKTYTGKFEVQNYREGFGFGRVWFE